MQPHAVPPHRLQHGERADHVAAQERFGVVQRVVDVRLRREVHDDVGVGHQRRHQVGVGDVTFDHSDRVLQPGK